MTTEPRRIVGDDLKQLMEEADSDSVVKLRPVVPSDLSADLTA